MKIFVFLSILSLVYSAPAPQEETPDVVPYIHNEIEALPYEHDPTGDVAEAYVHEELEALPYEHEEPEPAAPVVPHPVFAYSYAPVALVAVTNYAALPKVAAGSAVISPYHFVAAGYKTGCVNSVGSVVPCHL